MKQLAMLIMLLFATHSAMATQAPQSAASGTQAVPERPEADRARDANRKPQSVLEILGIGEGMRVMDVIAAGGYYTEVLSDAVGKSGKVYAQNPPMVLRFRDGANDKALSARLSDNRLSNVERIDMEIAEARVEPGSLDAAITALNLHDLYNRDPDAAVQMLKNIRRLLKPGGVLGVIDHVGVAGQDNANLHRMEKSKAIEALLEAGFRVESESPLLANPADDHTLQVFAPEIRGNTDRFLLKAVKPG